MGKTVFVVVRMFQGVVDDAIVYTREGRAVAELNKYVKQYLSLDDINKYGYDAALDQSKIAGTTMIVTELIED